MEISEKLLEVVEKSKKWLIASSAAWGADRGGVCRGNAVYADTGLQVIVPHSACHSWVTYAFGKACFGNGGAHYHKWGLEYVEGASAFLTLSCHSKVRSANVCSDEASDFLIDWIANESPFSEFVLNRDDPVSLHEGGVVLLCGPGGMTLAQTMWVCKVLRFTVEGGSASEAFMTLVKGGVDPMLAVYVASHVRSIVNGATFGYTGLENHSTVINTDTDIVGMMQRNLNPKAYSTHEVFIRDKSAMPKKFTADKNGSTQVKGFCKPMKKSDGWGGFVDSVGANGDAFIQQTLAWQDQFKYCLLPSLSTLVPEDVLALPDLNTVYLDLDL